MRASEKVVAASLLVFLTGTSPTSIPAGQQTFGLGQPHVTSGSTLVKITTSADAKLIVAAVLLAIAGGLIAGMAGGLRAARLRPAVALRTVE